MWARHVRLPMTSGEIQRGVGWTHFNLPVASLVHSSRINQTMACFTYYFDRAFGPDIDGGFTEIELRRLIQAANHGGIGDDGIVSAHLLWVDMFFFNKIGKPHSSSTTGKYAAAFSLPSTGQILHISWLRHVKLAARVLVLDKFLNFLSLRMKTSLAWKGILVASISKLLPMNRLSSTASGHIRVRDCPLKTILSSDGKVLAFMNQGFRYFFLIGRQEGQISQPNRNFFQGQQRFTSCSSDIVGFWFHGAAASCALGVQPRPAPPPSPTTQLPQMLRKAILSKINSSQDSA